LAAHVRSFVVRITLTRRRNQGGVDDLTRHGDVTKLACHSLPQKNRAKASLYACYLAINLQNFGGSDVELAAGRRPGSSSKVEIAERLTVVSQTMKQASLCSSIVQGGGKRAMVPIYQAAPSPPSDRACQSLARAVRELAVRLPLAEPQGRGASL
jgi:hypothetical protein